MLQGPQKLKFKKTKKGKLKRYNYKKTNNILYFGTLGLKATNSGFLNLKQIEAARKIIVKKTKRKTKLWIKIFPQIPVTAKATGVRMGKGKGQFSHWGARIKSGTVLFEICGTNIQNLIIALKCGAKKLPLKTKIFN
jgi:large subunit ribosomal protein L16